MAAPAPMMGSDPYRGLQLTTARWDQPQVGALQPGVEVAELRLG